MEHFITHLFRKISRKKPVSIKAEDLRIDIFSSGPANNPNYAIKVTHLPTGESVIEIGHNRLACKEICIRKLRARLEQ